MYPFLFNKFQIFLVRDIFDFLVSCGLLTDKKKEKEKKKKESERARERENERVWYGRVYTHACIHKRIFLSHIYYSHRIWEEILNRIFRKWNWYEYKIIISVPVSFEVHYRIIYFEGWTFFYYGIHLLPKMGKDYS